MASTTVEAFSISHAAILDGTTGLDAADGDIYGVRSGTIAADIGNYDNTGDDSILSSWYWLNYATVTIEGGYLPLSMMALLAGTTVDTTGVAPNDTNSMELWGEDVANQPSRPLRLHMPSKDKDGVVRTMDIVLYKVQFAPFNFTGPAYKSGLLVNYTGRALLSDKDEKGDPLAKRAVGRLINLP